jgi:N-acetylglutamate synthase-like GNAT family acetyltransferase
MPARITALNVLGTPLATAFVHRSVEASARGGDNRYWVAVHPDDEVVGFAQLRRGMRAAVINNLHVSPDYQGRGIGHRLLERMTAAIEARDVSADVFLESPVSRALFGRIGFEVIHTHHWHLVETDGPGALEVVVRDLPQADTVHAAFGISSLLIETRTGVHHVGRMGDAFYRVTTAAAIRDPVLLPALALLDPARTVLAIIDASDDPLPGPPELVSERLHAPVDLLIARYGA